MIQNQTRKEIHEQSDLKDWLLNRGIKIFSATAQSTFTNWTGTSINKKSGVRKGLPDMIICLPASQTYKGVNILLFIEMKRIKGGVVSKEQKEWLAFLESINDQVVAKVCYGYNEAKQLLKTLLKPPIIDERPMEDQEWFKNQ